MRCAFTADGAVRLRGVQVADLLIPIGELVQRTAWYWPDQGVQWPAYLLIAIGWALTTAIVAGAAAGSRGGQAPWVPATMNSRARERPS